MAGRKFLRLFTGVAAGAFIVFLAFILASTGIFGTGAETWAKRILGKAKELYSENGELLRYALAAFGALTTLLSGGWAIFKLWHFSERHMPQRIEEFLDRNAILLDGARPMLLKSIEAPGPQKPWKAPIAFVGPMNDAIKEIRVKNEKPLNVKSALSSLDDAIDQLIAKLDDWQEYERQTKQQLMDAQVLRGVLLAAQAGMERGTRSAVDDECALGDFTAAAAQANDLPTLHGSIEARYYAALQKLRLGRINEAEAELTRIINDTSTLQSISRSRSLYTRTRIRLEHRNAPAGGAIGPLAQAVASLPPGYPPTEEIAEIHLLRGRVNKAQGNPIAANCFDDAINVLDRGKLTSQRARAIREEVEREQQLSFAPPLAANASG